MKYGGRIGQYVKFDNKLWIILYDDIYTEDSHGLQMIAQKPSDKKIMLGPMDETVPNDIEGSINKAIYSYNHAIEKLNNECEKLVKNSNIIISVRSIGTNPIINKEFESSTENFYSSYLDEWGKSEYNNKIKTTYRNISDSTALRDINYWSNNNINALGEDAFWYAMNYTREGEKDGKIEIKGALGNSSSSSMRNLFTITETLNSSVSNNSLKILPVVTLIPGALQNKDGDGSYENPYILD